MVANSSPDTNPLAGRGMLGQGRTLFPGAPFSKTSVTHIYEPAFESPSLRQELPLLRASNLPNSAVESISNPGEMDAHD
jgi:hypothetical protein